MLSTKLWYGAKYSYIIFEILAAASAIVMLLSPWWGHRPYWANDTVVRMILDNYAIIILPAALVIYKSIFTAFMLITTIDDI